MGTTIKNLPIIFCTRLLIQIHTLYRSSIEQRVVEAAGGEGELIDKVCEIVDSTISQTCMFERGEDDVQTKNNMQTLLIHAHNNFYAQIVMFKVQSLLKKTNKKKTSNCAFLKCNCKNVFVFLINIVDLLPRYYHTLGF